jgi:hypothetical protein
VQAPPLLLRGELAAGFTVLAVVEKRPIPPNDPHHRLMELIEAISKDVAQHLGIGRIAPFGERSGGL